MQSETLPMTKRILLIGQGEIADFIASSLRKAGFEIQALSDTQDISNIEKSEFIAILDVFNLERKEEDLDLLTHNSGSVENLIKLSAKTKTPYIFLFTETRPEDETSTEMAVKLIKKISKYKKFIFSLVCTGEVYSPTINTSTELKTYLDDITSGTSLYVREDMKRINLIHKDDLSSGIIKIIDVIQSGKRLDQTYTLLPEESITELELAHFLNELTELPLVIQYAGDAITTSYEKDDRNLNYPPKWSPDVSLEAGLIEIFKDKDIPTQSDLYEEKKEENIKLAQENLAARVKKQNTKIDQYDPYESHYYSQIVEADPDQQESEEDILFKETHAYVDDYSINLPSKKNHSHLQTAQSTELQKKSETKKKSRKRAYPFLKTNRQKKGAIASLAVILMISLLIPSFLFTYKISTGYNHLKQSSQAFKSLNLDVSKEEGQRAIEKLSSIKEIPKPVLLVLKIWGTSESEIRAFINTSIKLAKIENMLASTEYIPNTNQTKPTQIAFSSSNVLGAQSNRSSQETFSKAIELMDTMSSSTELSKEENSLLNGLNQIQQDVLTNKDKLIKLRNIDLVLSKILGYGDPATYIVVVQNPEKIRATGGAIENFFILNVKDGNFEAEFSPTLKELDNQIKLNDLSTPPPLPIRKVYNDTALLMSTANWNPDFPSSAKTINQLYTNATGNPINGVLAIQSESLKDLQTLISNRWNVKLLKNLFYALENKKILMYHTNSQIQEQLLQNGWAGEIKPASDDYLYVIDSNLSNVNSKSEISREINYVAEHPNDNHGFLRKLKITYRNNNTTESYINHLRVIVPRDAFLNSVRLITEEDEKNITRKVMIESYGEKAMYKTDLLIEPQKSVAVLIEYESQKTLLGKEKISIYMQKQPGSNPDPLSITYIFSTPPVDNPKIPQGAVLKNNSLTISKIFDRDINVDIPL